MKFICVQPAINYYTWQVEVMVNNFVNNGVNPEDIHIVCGYRGVVPAIWKQLEQGYPKVKFFFYEDRRYKPTYISSIRPHILHQHWLHNPELEKDVTING